MKDDLYRMVGEYLLDAQAREDRQMIMLRLLKVAFICAAIGLAFVAGRVTAAPLIHATPVQDLFKAAVKFGGYEQKCMGRRGGCPMPAVLVQHIDNANIEGQFDWRTPMLVKINVTEHLVPGSLDFNETLVHEFVHYLQWLFGELGPQSSSTCEVTSIEGPAYAAGAAYLAQFGIQKDYSGQMFEMIIQEAFCQAGAM